MNARNLAISVSVLGAFVIFVGLALVNVPAALVFLGVLLCLVGLAVIDT